MCGVPWFDKDSTPQTDFQPVSRLLTQEISDGLRISMADDMQEEIAMIVLARILQKIHEKNEKGLLLPQINSI